MSDAHAATVDVYEPAMNETFNGKLAMWLFLCSEVMFFSGLLGAYMALRIGHPENFEFGHNHLHTPLNIGIATFNTALLITSSLTMALAVLYGQQNKRDKQRLFLVITALMGLAFLCVKSYEYYNKIHDGLLPNHDLFFAFYWTLTFIHGVHILAGVVPILGLAYFSRKRDVSGETEMVGLYWHFVDLVWIFLFPLLYLI
ncbi:MAG TPA: cytochrome c oxidase subunit 3 [Planctomycetota bacterium]|nr:cytochrome c oxidase subunit 3 [Planctomycetota bacterium]